MAEIIFGVDHGNGNMKGVHVNFPCGLVRYTSEPGRFMNEDILEYNGVYYTLSETRMPFKADKTVDEDYFILTLFSLALEAKERGITLSGKDIVLGVGLPPADFGQQAPGFKKYFMEHSKHGISFRFNGKPVNCYLKDVLVSPQNFAAVMCYKASLFRQYRTVNCIDIGDGTVDLLVIRKGHPDLSVRVSDRSGMAILRSEISNSIQQNYGIHLESSDVEQVLMQEATILDEEVVREIQKISLEPVSLETPIGEEEDSHLGDFIQDDNVPVPAEAAAFTLLREQLDEVLGTLTEREQKVLKLRFGLEDGRARTLEEVGKEFKVTRERIRQIEAKALRKLRHPSRSRKLKDYLE